VRIKDVEELVGITRKNIRFYEKEGLLTPGRESENSYRDYSQADIDRLKQIKLLRKLDMPISEIKAIFEGELSLTSAARRHSIAIDQQISSLHKAEEMCDRIVAEGVQLAELDTDAYLSGMENMEKEGAVFSNIVKNDVMKKYFGPVAATVVIVAIAVSLLAFFLWENKADPAPGFVVAYFCIIAAVLALGTIIALFTRIREIRKGEEDDLSNY